MDALIKEVIKWAGERDLIKYENRFAQLTKVVEELGELSGAILKSNKEGIIDGLGDVLVTVIILSHQLGFNPKDCLEHALIQIRDRKGKTINGTFIKESE